MGKIERGCCGFEAAAASFLRPPAPCVPNGVMKFGIFRKNKNI
jgi:hypothetical protein